MLVDAHHHLWNLSEVNYPWLMEKGATRFFGDPTPIQRNYLLDEHISKLEPFKFNASVHVQVGAKDGWQEAKWIDEIATNSKNWKIVQVAFCDLASPNFQDQINKLSKFTSLRGVRQIIGRAEKEDALTGTNNLLNDPKFLDGLKHISKLGLTFDLQLTPNLYHETSILLQEVPDLRVAVCHCGSPQERNGKYLEDWAEKLSKLSKRENTYCKISGLGMFDKNWNADSIQPIIRHCLDQFGSKRLMFGSNFPVDSLYSSFSKLYLEISQLIPEQFHGKIFAENCRNFYQF